MKRRATRVTAVEDQAAARPMAILSRMDRSRTDRRMAFHEDLVTGVEIVVGTDQDTGLARIPATHHWRKTTQTVVLSRTANSVAPQGFF